MFHVLDDELKDGLDRAADTRFTHDQFFNQMGQKESHLPANQAVQ